MSSKLDYFSKEDREGILTGTKGVSSDEVVNLIRGHIISELDRILRVLVKAAAFGHGKFGNSGASGEEEFIPIKDRLNLSMNLVKLLISTQGRDLSDTDADNTPEKLLERLGLSGKTATSEDT